MNTKSYLGARLAPLDDIVHQAEIIASRETLQAILRIRESLRRVVQAAVQSMRRDLGIQDPPPEGGAASERTGPEDA